MTPSLRSDESHATVARERHAGRERRLDDVLDRLRDVVRCADPANGGEFRVRVERALPSSIVEEAPPGRVDNARRDQDPQLSERLQAALLGPRRDLIQQILEDGIASGQLRRDVEPKLVADLLFGTMWYRLLGRHEPVDDRLADDLVDVVRRLLTTP